MTSLWPVNKSLSLLAASFNLVGLTSEAFRLTPHGVNTAMVFHGAYCILIGYLIFQVGLPASNSGRAHGIRWFELADVSPPLRSQNILSPYNLACGLIGEASVFLWLLVMGVNVQRWKEQPSAPGLRA